MFGYVVINKSELKIREFEEYRGFYCGLCQSLHCRYGRSGQITLNYDLNFLAILLTSLYESPTTSTKSRCIVHPFQKQLKFHNEMIDYCADMTVLLSYFKCEDDWLDEKKWSGYAEMKLLHKKVKQLQQRYPRKWETIQFCLDEIHKLEQADTKDIDAIGNLSGQMMACIFAVKEDMWTTTLSQMGFYLGKFIYLMDAWEDVEKDTKNGNFNLFKEQQANADFDRQVRDLLEMMIASCCEYFEVLPILDYASILRNILYSGVWTRYELKMKKKGEKNNESV